jgi:undecaprenyl-diphosphatase
MELLNVIFLSLIQGVTEFLPISSSAHLILFPTFSGNKDQGLLIDISVHLGSLIAVTTFFWPDVKAVIVATAKFFSKNLDSSDRNLVICLMVATIPAVVLGAILKYSGLYDYIRDSTLIIGLAMFGFGILLWFSDRNEQVDVKIYDWTVRHALILGFWQMLALIPGTSRSGITITGARFLNYDRKSAIKISMLMSIPTIIAAATLEFYSLGFKSLSVNWIEIILAVIISALAAFGALSLMVRLLTTINFTPYVLYRLSLGSILIIWAFM